LLESGRAIRRRCERVFSVKVGCPSVSIWLRHPPCDNLLEGGGNKIKESRLTKMMASPQEQVTEALERRPGERRAPGRNFASSERAVPTVGSLLAGRTSVPSRLAIHGNLAFSCFAGDFYK